MIFIVCVTYKNLTACEKNGNDVVFWDDYHRFTTCENLPHPQKWRKKTSLFWTCENQMCNFKKNL